MTLRRRVLIGLFGLVVLFLVWGFLALAAAFFVLDSQNWMVRMAFYAIAGAGWLPFAMPIVTFMSRRG